MKIFQQIKEYIAYIITFRLVLLNKRERIVLQNSLDPVDTFEGESLLRIINWPITRYYSDIRMISILDEFSFKSFKKQCRIISPRPDNWKELIDLEQPHLLFVESAWQGNKGSWQYRVGNYNIHSENDLEKMVNYCKKLKIPTVFWNKEDPVHFEKFIKSAILFDVILTSDRRLINRYQRKAPIATVNCLPFAAEKSIHNPISREFRQNKSCFAGSFYANRFNDRKEDQLMILDAARTCGLDIYDRNYESKESDDFQFPERFEKHIIGQLSYNETIKAYKRYKVFLNVNSVIDSPTMLSRRVYELLACGTPVVSTRSKAIESQFGEDLVWMVDTSIEAENAIKTLLNDENEWKRRSIAGIRHVMKSHTYDHRFQRIVNYSGLNNSMLKTKPEKILIVAHINSQADYNTIIWSFKRQSWKDLKILLIDLNDIILIKSTDQISVVKTQNEVSAIINEHVKLLTIDFITFWNGEYLYLKYYLEDLVYAARYSGADVIIKPSELDQEYRFVANLNQDNFLLKIKSAQEYNLSTESLLNSQIGDIFSAGGKLYNSDAMNILINESGFLESSSENLALMGEI